MRRPRRFALLIGVVIAFGLVTVPAALDGPARAQQSDKQQQLQDQLDENSAQTQAARTQLAQAQAQRQQLDASLTSVTAQVSAANDRLAAAQGEVDRLGFESAMLQLKANQTVKQLDQAKSDVRRSAVLLYQHGDGTAMIGLLTGDTASGQLVEGKHYLQRVSDKRQGDARRVKRLEDALATQQQQVTTQKQAADAAAAAATAEKARLDSLAAQQQQARDAASSAEQHETTLVGNLRAQQDSIEADLQAESDRIGQQVRDAGDGPALGNGTFIRPVGGPISSPFGYRTDPVTGAQAFHGGLDLASPCGTPIKAAGTGVVMSAGFNSGGYGNMTLINHGAGLSSLYGHQSSIIVSAGQSVVQGQVIGYVGSTGKSTGCHLHFEVRVNGNPVNPLGYL